MLLSHGFDVQQHYDVDSKTLERALADFSDKAEGADTALVLFSGHGMEVIDKRDYFNVLAPSDAEIDITKKAFNVVRLDELMRPLKPSAFVP
jgi:uncharacterized caspase-like protein